MADSRAQCVRSLTNHAAGGGVGGAGDLQGASWCLLQENTGLGREQIAV